MTVSEIFNHQRPSDMPCDVQYAVLRPSTADRGRCLMPATGRSGTASACLIAGLPLLKKAIGHDEDV